MINRSEAMTRVLSDMERSEYEILATTDPLTQPAAIITAQARILLLSFMRSNEFDELVKGRMMDR